MPYQSVCGMDAASEPTGTCLQRPWKGVHVLESPLSFLENFLESFWKSCLLSAEPATKGR